MEEKLTIGRIARASGVGVQAVRYYERRRLLLPDERRESGYRMYSREAVRRLRFIKNAQELGFSLDEIGRLLRLRVGRKGQCARVRNQARKRLEIVQEKIAALRAMKKTLRRLIRTCTARGTTRACPILESLEEPVR